MFKVIKNFFLYTIIISTIAVIFSFPAGINASAASPSLEVSSAHGVGGSTVNIKISIKNNPGLSALKLSVKYSKYLSLVNVSDNGLLGVAVIDPSYQNPQTLYWYNIKGSAKNGVVATLSFRVADYVPNGEAGVISVSTEEALDKNMKNVSFSTVNSTAICTHKSTSEKVISKSTCIRAGEINVVCNTCNKILQKKSAPLTEHTYGTFSVIKDATCTSTGVKVAVCVVCGQKYPATIAKKAHEYKDSVTIKGPTCTENGISVRSCKHCGDKIETEIMKMEHSFTKYTMTTSPTLYSEGEKTSKCVRCGVEQTEKVIPQLIDSATSVAVAAKVGTFDNGTTMLVKTVSMSDSIYTNLRAAMSDITTSFKTYNISYVNNSQPVSPKGTITLYIPLKNYDFDTAQLYFYDENSQTTERISVEYYEAEDNTKTLVKPYVKFTTNKVGYFILANTAKATAASGKNEDKSAVSNVINSNSGLLVWVGVGVVVLVAFTLITWFIISKVKNKKNKKKNNVSNLENFYTGIDANEKN
ncbi:MAG: hypothetical protein Q4B04_00095 [bacterium]|nr:hypothetical protein [bacterium]